MDNSLLKRIKTEPFKFKEYASQIVLVPFFYYNVTDDLLDYKHGFLNNLNNLIPEAVNGKPIVISKPIVDANLPSIN